MDLPTFKNLPSHLRKKIIAELQNVHKTLNTSSISKIKPAINCPFCNSSNFSHNGSSVSCKPRFKCKKCKKTFSETTGTPIHAIKKQKEFFVFFKHMSSGYQTLHNMAENTGIAVSTAFEWRHKILSAFNEPIHKYEGITDFNTDEFSFSRKGIRNEKSKTKENSAKSNVLAIADYSNHSQLTLLSVGNLSSIDFPENLVEKIKNGAIVLAPFKIPLVKFSNSKKLGFTLFRPDNKYNKFDVRNADKLHEGINNYIRKKMKGVSTKYFQSYLEWVDKIIGLKKTSVDYWNSLLKNNLAWGRYVNREVIFCNFIKSKTEIQYEISLKRSWKTANKFLLR